MVLAIRVMCVPRTVRIVLLTGYLYLQRPTYSSHEANHASNWLLDFLGIWKTRAGRGVGIVSEEVGDTRR